MQLSDEQLDAIYVEAFKKDRAEHMRAYARAAIDAALRAQADARPVAMEYVAVADDGGKLSWVSGRKPRDCALYAIAPTNSGLAPAFYVTSVLSAQAAADVSEIYTHPEASAPGADERATELGDRDLFKQYCEDMGWKFYLVDMYVPSDADYYALSEVMKARWDGFKAGRSFIGPPNRAAKSSQRAGVAEDAARYRWLRERRFYKADNPHTSMYHKGGCDTGWLYLKTLDRDGLDAAIDAAISAAATQQQQEG